MGIEFRETLLAERLVPFSDEGISPTVKMRFTFGDCSVCCIIRFCTMPAQFTPTCNAHLDAGAPLAAGDLRKLSEAQRRRLTRFTSAFHEAVASGPLTEFQALENEADHDSFLRTGADGRGIVCCFNRTDQARLFRGPGNCRFVNVETGSEEMLVPAHDCAMFAVIPKTARKPGGTSA